MRTIALAALLAACLAGPAWSAAPFEPGVAEAPAGQQLQVLLDRVKLEQSHLRTLESDFVQHRQSAMLAQPEESHGVFSYQAPNKVRWEYLSPKELTLLIRDQQMTTWYRDLGRADRVNVGKYSAQVLRYLGAGGSLQTLLEYFTVRLAVPKNTAEPFRLELLPRYARIAKRMKEVDLWLDRTTYLPVRLRYEEADGDSTEYRFQNLRVNAGLPGDRFDLNLPQSVKVRTIELGHGAQ